MNNKLIELRMEQSGMSAYYIWKKTGIKKNQTVNDVANGKTDMNNIKVDTYNRIAQTLFSTTELAMIDSYLIKNVDVFNSFYKQALISALNSKDVEISRSGAVYHDENANPTQAKPHIRLRWGFLDDAPINKAGIVQSSGRYLHELLIFNNDLYNHNEMSKGKKRKMELVKEYVNKL